MSTLNLPEDIFPKDMSPGEANLIIEVQRDLDRIDEMSALLDRAGVTKVVLDCTDEYAEELRELTDAEVLTLDEAYD